MYHAGTRHRNQDQPERRCRRRCPASAGHGTRPQQSVFLPTVVGAMMMTMSLRLLAGCALLSSVTAYNNGMAKK